MRVETIKLKKYPGNRLRGFYSLSEASKVSPCVSRPDLVDARNRTTDRAPRGERNKVKRNKNDCGVRALAICANIPYDRAAALLADDRDAGGRTWSVDISRAFDALGFTVTEIDVTARTLRTLDRELKRGVFFVYSRDHFTALVDGRTYDTARGKLRRIRWVWQIEVETGA